MSNLIFEKVIDISCKYAYLCVYDKFNKHNPFMEIAITDDGEIEFNFYSYDRNITLTMNDLDQIQKKALDLLYFELENEKYL